MNVLPIKRSTDLAFPDLWPTATYESVGHLLFRQQPVTVDTQRYPFAVKSHLMGPPITLVFQPNDTVLYQLAPDTKKSDAKPFLQWYDKCGEKLKALSRVFNGTVHGKMGQLVEDGEIKVFLCVYYVVQAGEVFLDEPSLNRLLKVRDGLVDGIMHVMPVLKVATILVDKPDGKFTCRDLSTRECGVAGDIVCFPVADKELRTAEDGTENAPPRLTSTAVHMRFSAFVQELKH